MDINLLNRFLNNDCSDLEKQEVEAWLLNPNNDELISKWMAEHWDNTNAIENTTNENLNYTRIRAIIQARIGLHRNSDRKNAKVVILDFIKNNKPFRYVAAAAIIFSFITNLYFLFSNNRNAERGITGTEKRVSPPDIAPPNSTNAVLTLANGQKIQLDSVGKGILATEGTVKVAKNELGEIVYSESAKTNSISYNTMSLPKGSKPIRLVLSDGSLVWLNAASSVTFPTAFIGSERKVSITGEAYFEVAHNASKPFYVSHDDITVRVLGTHFNVNTYQDERNIKVTLLEGSVNVSKGNNSARLKPGEQAVVAKDKIGLITNIDLEEVMSWKNGQFYFKGTELKSIMRQIEKYYNVEVEFKDDINDEFYAKMERNINVSEFLKKLELTNIVHFKIEGNKITVMK